MCQYIALSYWDVVLAAVFLLINGGLSLWLDLRLERQLLIASLRMVVQLLLIGLGMADDRPFRVKSDWISFDPEAKSDAA